VQGASAAAIPNTSAASPGRGSGIAAGALLLLGALLGGRWRRPSRR
jgi:MYXO-CTERM domain-containing protein